MVERGGAVGVASAWKARPAGGVSAGGNGEGATAGVATEEQALESRQTKSQRSRHLFMRKPSGALRVMKTRAFFPTNELGLKHGQARSHHVVERRLTIHLPKVRL